MYLLLENDIPMLATKNPFDIEKFLISESQKCKLSLKGTSGWYWMENNERIKRIFRIVELNLEEPESGKLIISLPYIR